MKFFYKNKRDHWKKCVSEFKECVSEFSLICKMQGQVKYVLPKTNLPIHVQTQSQVRDMVEMHCSDDPIYPGYTVILMCLTFNDVSK